MTRETYEILVCGKYADQPVSIFLQGGRTENGRNRFIAGMICRAGSRSNATLVGELKIPRAV